MILTLNKLGIFTVVECGQLLNNGTSGSIMTPGYPLTNYPTDVDCKFEILAPAGTTVRLYDSVIPRYKS